MGILRRSRRDDVDVDSVLANLHRVADVATLPIRRVIDLRRSGDTDPVEAELEPAPPADGRAPR